MEPYAFVIMLLGCGAGYPGCREKPSVRSSCTWPIQALKCSDLMFNQPPQQK